MDCVLKKKKKRKGRICGAVFFLLLALMMGEVRQVLTLKGSEMEYYSAIAAYRGFYRMKRDSVDVLFLGSSNCYCGFCPQELYEKEGITSYNLASSQQSVLMSYYWLKEALRYQHPKAVVLETFYFMFPMGNEGSVHKALDFMNLSPVKLQAVRAVCSANPETFRETDFLFPWMRYHERWKELKKEDFLWYQLSRQDELKGWSPLHAEYGKEKPASAGNVSGEISEENAIDPLCLTYLQKICTLCRENGITLILIKTPVKEETWNSERHTAVQRFAEENGIPFYDFNGEEFSRKTGYDIAEDNGDSMHANVRGAVLITDEAGRILKKETDLEPHKDDQFEKTEEFAQRQLAWPGK